jgi:hypothetical protein
VNELGGVTVDLIVEIKVEDRRAAAAAFYKVAPDATFSGAVERWILTGEAGHVPTILIAIAKAIAEAHAQSFRRGYECGHEHARADREISERMNKLRIKR